ncbi:hypothetical protein AURDEDRAFT_164503 [Auricularia subglabra TFB-10046 SS5]|nr:hypothetical protein AURDEDRAFT_164503 [Auricularia subglabra TFB-10046 SS5]
MSKRSPENPDFKSGVTWQSDGKTFKGIVLSGPNPFDAYMIGVVEPKVAHSIVKLYGKDLQPAQVTYVRPGDTMHMPTHRREPENSGDGPF